MDTPFCSLLLLPPRARSLCSSGPWAVVMSLRCRSVALVRAPSLRDVYARGGSNVQVSAALSNLFLLEAIMSRFVSRIGYYHLIWVVTPARLLVNNS